MGATAAWARGRLGSVVARICAGALAAGVLGAVAAAPADAATFDPIPSVSWRDSAFGQVVTNGSGVWLGVARSNTDPQVVVVRRSTDAGATWATTGMFRGEAGGATRPWISVDGDRVAVSFIGAWSDASVVPPLVREAPYLVTSDDAGLSWRTMLRMDGGAFEARVAVDDDRYWVAWENPGGVRLRGLAADGRTVFATRSYPGAVGPHLGAGDGLMMLAWVDWPMGGQRVIRTVTATDRTVRNPSAVDLPGAWPGSTRSSVAVAGGGAHLLLVRRGEDVPGGGPDELFVSTAGTTGLMGTPVAVPRPVGVTAGSVGQGQADIAAAPGTVIVAQSQSGVLSVSTSSDRGASFSAAVPAGGSGASGASVLGVGIAVPDVTRPQARFAWSVAPRYVDSSGDGLADPASTREQVAAGATLSVRLDACASTGGPGATISATGYTWIVDGDLLSDSDCTADIPVSDGKPTSVRLLVEDSAGATDTVEQTVTPQDHLVVSLGDSVASGEGNIHPSGTWVDPPCHRSSLAGPALAARQLEEADPHSSVTFVQLACSGAAIVDTPEVPGVDDDATGGLLDGYSGVDPVPGERRNGQLVQMADLAGSRPIDAATLSIGANDVRFKDVLIDCGLTTRCDQGATRTRLEAALGALPARYSRLAAAMPGLGLPNDRVLITEYFDATTDGTGVVQMRCAAAGGGLFDDDEAQWARTGVTGQLNAAVRAGAAAHGWTFVGGIASAFERHGYCADDNWVMTAPESISSQGWYEGAFHPNNAGQRVYASALYAQLRGTLADDSTANGGAQVADLGDAMVLAATGPRSESLVAIPVRTTGGLPSVGAVRRVDSLVAGSGLLAPAGAPAVDRSAALGAWWQASGDGAYTTDIRVARLATRPNITVRSVDVVQAPADGARLVAGRDALVQATIDAYITEATKVPVSTRVTEIAGDGTSTDLVEVDEQVQLKPGRNVVLLPAAPIAPADGTRITAEVIVEDPPGASPSDGFDNRMQTTRERIVLETRPLKLLVGDAYVGKGSVACNDLRGAAERQVAFARATMPVDASGIDVEMFCGLKTNIAQSEKAVMEQIAWLDELARYLGIDAIVAVVPKGWLQQAVRGAVGISVRGQRGIILEVSASSSALAHELGHMYGLKHPQPEGTALPASGALVSKRLARAGTDFMASFVQPKPWVAGSTWDALVARIGGPAQAPVAIDPNGDDVWVRGTAVQLPDGTWGLTTGELLPADAGAPPTGPTVPGGSGSLDPTDLDDLQMERLTATPVDAAGDPVGAAEPIPVGDVDPLLAPGASLGDTPVGYGFATRLPVPPGAVAFRLTWSDPAGQTDLGALALSVEAPVVTLTAPVAGTRVARGSDLTVSWTATDADSDEATLTHRVLVSGDDGASWQPLADTGTATSVTLPMPQDIGGDQVRVRVVTSDGHRLGEATSAAFSAEPDLTLGSDRLVGVRLSRTGAYDGNRLLTMKPDGSGAAFVILPTQLENIDGQVNGCIPGEPSSCPARYSGPVWSGQGEEILFASNLLLASVEGDQAGRRWLGGNRLWSVRADGTGLTRITADGGDASYWGADGAGISLGRSDLQCPAVSPDGQRVAFLMAGSSSGDRRASIWTIQRSGSGWSLPTRVFVADDGRAVSLPAGWTSLDNPRVFLSYDPGAGNRTSCPEWSPDGTSLAFIGAAVVFTENDPNGTKRTRFDDSPVVVIDADGTDVRVISPRPAYKQGTGPYISSLYQRDWNWSVDWAEGSDPVVVRAFTDPALVDINNTTAPKFFGIFGLDPATSAFTRITPAPDPTSVERPALKVRIAPGGELYSSTWFGRCTTTGLVLVDPATGLYELFPADLTQPCGDPAVNSYPDYIDDQFDWGRPSTGGGGGGALPLVPDAQPDDAPDPGSDPADPDVTEPQTTADPLEGATTYPAPGRAAPAGPISVVAGEPTVIELRTTDGLPERFVVSDAPAADRLTVTGPDPDGGSPGAEATSDAFGRLVVRSTPGFVGTVTFGVRVVDGDPTPATITIEVQGNRAPRAVDDSLTLPALVESAIDPATLIANDTDPDGSAGALRIASAFGASAGRVTLLEDGTLRFAAGDPGTVTFRYVVVDAAGAAAEGRVSVTVLAAANPPTTNPPTPKPPVTTTRTVTRQVRVLFPYLSTQLTTLQKRKLRAVLATIPPSASVTASAVGVVRAVGATPADRRRALQRARTVATFLKSTGEVDRVRVSNAGRTRSTKPTARAVQVTITYTVSQTVYPG